MPEASSTSREKPETEYIERINELERANEKLHREISELRVVKDTLRQEKEFAERLVETAQVIVLVLNTEGRIVWFNPYLEEITGFRLSEVSGEEWLTTFIVSSHRKRSNDLISSALEEERTFNGFAPIITRKGAEAEIDWSYKSLKNNDGDVVGLIAIGHDVTKLKQATEALRRSEEKYRSIVEQSYEGIILTNERGVIIEWNNAQERITGLTRKEVLGKLIWDVQYQADPDKRRSPEQYQQVRSMLLELFKQDGSPWIKRMAEHEIQRPDGKRRLIQSLMFPIEMGEVLLVGAITRDITELKRNEEELMFLGSIAHQVSDAIIVTNRDYKITYINQAVVDLYGYERRELEGRDPIILNAVPLAEEIQKDIFKTVSAGKTWTGELINRKKDGSTFHIESKVSPLYDKKGQIYAHIAINRDITSRKRTEEELRRERDKVQNFLDIARVIIVVISADQRVVLINRTGCEVLGYKEEEIIGKNWFDNFLPRKYLKSIKSMAVQLFSGDVLTVKDIENPVVTKSGEERMIAWRNTVLRDEKGRITHILSSGEDVTERRQAEAALRESEKKYRKLAETAKDFILIVDLKGHIEYVNNAARELSGYSEDELLKMNILDLLTDTERERLRRRFIKRTVTEAGVFLINTEFINKAGAVRSLEASVSLLRERGVKARLLVIGRDDTERREAVEALRESRKWFSTTLNSIADAVIATDIQGMVTFINPVAEKLTGWKHADAVGQSLEKVYHVVSEISGEPVKSPLRRMVGNGLVRDHTDHPILIARDGRNYPIDENAAPIMDESGNLLGAVLVFSDITQRRLTEDQIKRSLEEKEVLLKEIHHRVKNNLQVISSMLYLQSRYVKDKQTLDILKESQNRVKSMALIHEKLYQSSDLVKIDFYEYIRSLATHLLHSYGKVSDAVDFKLDVGDVLLDLDTAIPCGLILNELVSNSLKHAFPDDFLSDQGNGFRRKISININADNDKIIMTMGDNGIGFPDELDFRSTESLGMRIVITLTEQLNGTIELNRSHGTEFRIRFTKQSHSSRE